MTAEDRKRQQIHADAVRSDFQDLEMRKLIKNPEFTILRFTVHANRLIADADRIKAGYAKREITEMSEEDKAAIQDAGNAQAILESIERIGAEEDSA
ncbi:MAG: hypothetical protein ABWX90_03925 [Candidatus Saccharimonadales bacterium]